MDEHENRPTGLQQSAKAERERAMANLFNALARLADAGKDLLIEALAQEKSPPGRQR